MHPRRRRGEFVLGAREFGSAWRPQRSLSAGGQWREARGAAAGLFCLVFGGGAIEPTITQPGGVKELDIAINHACSAVYGGDDGARTRDLCRDRAAL